MTFIIYLKSGRRVTYNSRFTDEDSALGGVCAKYPDAKYPDADYIESF